MADGKEHAHPDGLIKFVKTQPAEYVRQTAEWVKKEYPGSADELLPQLREIYRNKTKT